MILEPLRERMVADLGQVEAVNLTTDAVKWGLPCGGCYVGERDARALVGIRLGKHERRILLSAVPGSKVGYRAGSEAGSEMLRPKIAYPDGPSRAAEEANRRALKKLDSAGLIELSRDYLYRSDDDTPDWFWKKMAASRYWGMGRRYRTAALTPLGELVVERYRDELENGKPIRWSKHIDDLAKDVRKPLRELFRQFGLWTGGVVAMAGFGAAFARTAEGRERAAKKREGAKRFQAFVDSLDG